MASPLHFYFGVMKMLKVNPQLGWLEALEGGRLLERRLNITAHNLANVDTPGYKKDILSFREVLMRKFPRGWRTFKEVTVKTDFRQGPIQYTGNPLDVAIAGEGFFKVETPQGTAYTRAGNFRLDSQRRLVTAEGYPVLANGAPIIVDPGLAKGGVITLENTRFLIADDGTVSIDGTEIGRLDIVTFKDLSTLKKLGENLFQGDETQEIPVEAPDVRQGHLEESNADPLEEIVNLIDIQREFEAIQKSLRGSDETTGRMIETYGRT